MTDIEVAALALFKDYTFLQLKAFSTFEHQSEQEKAILNQALTYHRIYNNIKLEAGK